MGQPKAFFSRVFKKWESVVPLKHRACVYTFLNHGWRWSAEWSVIWMKADCRFLSLCTQSFKETCPATAVEILPSILINAQKSYATTHLPDFRSHAMKRSIKYYLLAAENHPLVKLIKTACLPDFDVLSKWKVVPILLFCNPRSCWCDKLRFWALNWVVLENSIPTVELVLESSSSLVSLYIYTAMNTRTTDLTLNHKLMKSTELIRYWRYLHDLGRGL